MASHTGVFVTGSEPATGTGQRVSSSPASGDGTSSPGGESAGHAPFPPSFGDLYLGSFAAMLRLARVLVDSPETAEDLVQDAFVHLHRHWGGVRDPRSYLHRSVVNACRSHHRRAWRERARAPHEDERNGLGDRSGHDIVDGSA